MIFFSSSMSKRGVVSTFVRLSALMFFCVATGAVAQNAQLSGLVTDASKAVIPNASIEITANDTQSKYSAVSNGDGVFSFVSLTPGTYTIKASASGFDTETLENITLNVGSKASFTIVLQVGKITNTVSVDASSLQINTTDGSVSTVIDGQFVEDIPLNGRSLQSLMLLAPGTNQAQSQGPGSGGELSVNGQRAESNYFTVDGVSATAGAQYATGGQPGNGAGYSGSTPNETALGTTQSMISIDALQEFRATTSTYSAEYGRGPGGQYAFSSKGGTNTWHGSLFEYFRNDALDANNWFNTYYLPFTARQAERQNDFGGTIGGPAIIPHIYNGHDKTFFFFSYEGLRLDEPQAASSVTVPSLYLRENAVPVLRPFLNAFPLPNQGQGPEGNGDGTANYSGAYSAPASVDTFSARVDYNANPKLKFFARYSDVPNFQQQRASNDDNYATLYSENNRAHSSILGADYQFSPRLVNSLRFAYNRNRGNLVASLTDFGGAVAPDLETDVPGYTPSSIFNFNYTYAYPEIYMRPAFILQNQFNLVDSLSYQIGRHSLKAGIDYRVNRNAESLPAFREDTNYESYQDLLTNTPVPGNYDLDVIKAAQPTMDPDLTNLSLFVQDEWKATPRLSLSLGLRYELNPPPTDSRGHGPYTTTQVTNQSAIVIAPRGTPLYHTAYDNFAPRLGVAYKLKQGQGKETVARGGFGIFYDTGNSQSLIGYDYFNVGMGSEEYFNNTPGVDNGQRFPLTLAETQTVPPASAAAPYTGEVFAIDPNFQLPITLQWNVAIQQGLGTQQTLTVSYVGSHGGRLPVERFYYPSTPNFSNGDGFEVEQNAATADYNSLQIQFQRTMSHGLEALASYTYAHAIDEATSNFTVYDLERSSSDNDIRHAFQSAFVWHVPDVYHEGFRSALLSRWSIDSRIMSVTGEPKDIRSGYNVGPDGQYQLFHPNRVPGVPLYVHIIAATGKVAPGGRAINYAAFVPALNAEGQYIEGDSGRNAARLFGATQFDMAIHKDFKFRDSLGMQFRAEAFNAFNHPMFGDVYGGRATQTPALFGTADDTRNELLGGLNALYQNGGPRSLQLSLKLHF